MSELTETLAAWRRVAWVTSARGQEGYRRMVREADRKTATGELPAGTVSWAAMKTRLGL